jgi:hypothetical protein
LEYLETLDTGNADSHIHWIVCGGSGYSLRRQRSEGSDLFETFNDNGQQNQQLVARSHLFVGRNGHGYQKRRPYTSLRIDVKDGCPPQYIIRPLVAEWYQKQWHNYEMQSLTIRWIS